MPSRPPATEAATSRPLRLRARRDLVFFPQQGGAGRYWVVKDPVALRYFQLRDEECTVLRLLDGRRSLGELVDRFQTKFAPARLEESRLDRFLGSLHALGLVVSDHPGQAEPLLARRRENRRRAWVASAANVLAIRLPGIDPEGLLRRVDPLVRWLLHPWWVVLSVFLIAVVAFLALLNAGSLAERLPEAKLFFSSANLPWLALSLAMVKILHELGHAVVCRHFGCECHEIGLMLLVFTPCLYTDVTDSWTLPDKRRRIAVSAAGIHVELILASLAAIAWWATPEGPLNAFCLDILFVCSVGTVLLNGNPLLRYDGYYILSDWLEIPNLWQRSRAVVSGLCSSLLGGRPRQSAWPERRRFLLAAYGLLSIAYRFFVVILILSFLYRVLRPWRLELLAHAILAATVVAMLGVPATQAVRNRLASGGEGGWRLKAALLAAALVVLASVVPLPCRVRAPALLEEADADRVFVTVPGRLVEARAVGSAVAEGELLAKLDSAELGREISRLESEYGAEESYLAGLEARRSHDQQAAAELPAARQTLADLQRRLTARRGEAERLRLTAPRSGTVLPAPARHGDSDRQELPSWQGRPTDAENIGCYLETGTLVCLVGDPRRLRAVVYVDEQNVQLVRPGQPVRILLEQSRRAVLEGRVAVVGDAKVDSVPPRLAAVKAIPTVEDSGNARPLGAFYRLEVALEPTASPPAIGVRGQAKIEVTAQSLAQRAVRFFSRTLRRMR
ncbi:MAG: HlyD family efflux transporter periplasmic adaptor subunit [Thermoguttaceae bacterium]|jgi:putative peptide zinc metalloprotease protein